MPYIHDQEGAVDTYTVLEDISFKLGADIPDPADQQPLRRAGTTEALVKGTKVLLPVEQAEALVDKGKLARGSSDDVYKLLEG